MKWTKFAISALLMGCVLTASGCIDSPPSPPVTATGENARVLVPADPAEAALAQEFVDSRETYSYRLAVLKAYYSKVGAYVKSQWADKEMANLQRAQTFNWQGVKPNATAAGPTLDRADEIMLVEQVQEARKTWVGALNELHQHYVSSDQDFKAKMMANLQQRFVADRTYPYSVEAEVPPGDLRPREVITQADALYAEAYRLFRNGKRLPLFPDYNMERRALEKFVELVHTYPTSTKIALSAYFIGDIYKEYFKEDYRAVAWYERAWQWDPNITEPARFQAAVVLDYRLHNRGRALDLYREVLKHETFNGTNIGFSQRRINELMTEPGTE